MVYPHVHTYRVGLSGPVVYVSHVVGDTMVRRWASGRTERLRLSGGIWF